MATTGRFRVVREIGQSGRLGVLWLLLLAGPLGWIALLFLSGRDEGERLSVELPYTDAAYERFAAARRLRNISLVAATAAGVALFLLALSTQTGRAGLLLALATVALGAIVLAVTAEWRMGRASVGVDLDASRRWVTLSGVHPTFAAACTERRASATQY